MAHDIKAKKLDIQEIGNTEQISGEGGFSDSRVELKNKFKYPFNFQNLGDLDLIHKKYLLDIVGNINDSGFAEVFFLNEAEIKAITSYSDGVTVVDISDGKVYRFSFLSGEGLRPNDLMEEFGRWVEIGQLGGGSTELTPENTTVYDSTAVYEAGNVFVSYVNEMALEPYNEAAIYRSRVTTDAGVSPEDSLYDSDTTPTGKWEYQGQRVVIQDGGLTAMYYDNEAAIKAIKGYKNGNNVINITDGKVYEYNEAEQIGLRPNDSIGEYGRWRDKATIIKSDQTQKQTLTKSPIFDNLTPGTLLLVDSDKSIRTLIGLTWNDETKSLGINTTNTGAANLRVQGHLSVTAGDYYINNTEPRMRLSNNYVEVDAFRLGKGTSPYMGLFNEKIYVLYNGNVGIGTIAPTKKLHIGGTAGYVSSVDEGMGDTDFASHKFVNDSISAIVSSQTVTSSATVTPTGNKRENEVYITDQSEALTIENPSGTAVNGNTLLIRIKDDGTAREITWGANYKAFIQSLPVTTIAGKYSYFGFIYNSQSSTWDLVSVVDEM